MEIDVIANSPEQSEIQQEAWARKLRALITRVRTLQTLVRGEEDDERGLRPGTDSDTFKRETILQELFELEQMASEVLYEMQESEHSLFLGTLPPGSLSEALAQLVDATAEKLTLSSRVAFSGWERPLSDYLTRLLYRIAQEALGRVATHEGARRLRFSLDYQRAEIVMAVEDDGIPGADEQFVHNEMDGDAAVLPFLEAQPRAENDAQQLAAQTFRRLREIVESLGGSLIINSGVEQGVQLRVRIPMHIHELRRPRLLQEPTPPAPAQNQATAAQIKVLIVDGQTVSRAGLRRLLESYPDLEIVGEASDSVQAVSETAELLPHIVLLDAQLPGDQSLETLRQVRQLNSDMRVLLLANREDETQLYEALRAGAGGYILKDIAPDELAQAVRGVARGEMHIQPQLAARLLIRPGTVERGTMQESLTTREREVLQLLGRGLRNKEIAARLFVSERTVNFHLANIYAKLHVSGRTEALSKALEQGLLRV